MTTQPPTRDHLGLLADALPTTSEARGFAASPAGTAMLAELHDHVQDVAPRRVARRRVEPRRVLVATLAVAALGATAAAAATIVMQPVSPTQAMCFRTLDLKSDASQPTGAIEPNDPAATCTAQWDVMYPGVPQPAAMVNCVYPGGRGLFAAPATLGADPGAACASIGAGIPG